MRLQANARNHTLRRELQARRRLGAVTTELRHLLERVIQGRLPGTRVLAPGFHTKPYVLEHDNGNSYVVKMFSYSNLEQATVVANDIANYRNLLQKRGVSTPREFVTFAVGFEGRYSVVELASFAGEPMASVLTDANAEVFVEQILNQLFNLFEGAEEYLQVGIDPSCKNFVTDGSNVVYVDFYPARYVSNGKPQLGIPDSISDWICASQIQRYYTKEGILLIFTTQYLRHRPQDIEQLMKKIAQKAWARQEIQVMDYFTSLLPRQLKTSVFELRPTDCELFRLKAVADERISKEGLAELYAQTHISEMSGVMSSEGIAHALRLLA